jgi:hypothetical protein
VQLLSRPHHIERDSVVTVDGRSILLSGYGGAHWAALCFVTRIVRNDEALVHQLADFDEARIISLRARCAEDWLLGHNSEFSR